MRAPAHGAIHMARDRNCRCLRWRIAVREQRAIARFQVWGWSSTQMGARLIVVSNRVAVPRCASLTDRNYESFCGSGNHVGLPGQRDGFEPEVSLAVLPTAQSETPVPPKAATEILAQETGARSPCAAPKAAGRCCADWFSSIFRTSPQRRRRVAGLPRTSAPRKNWPRRSRRGTLVPLQPAGRRRVRASGSSPALC